MNMHAGIPAVRHVNVVEQKHVTNIVIISFSLETHPDEELWSFYILSGPEGAG